MRHLLLITMVVAAVTLVGCRTKPVTNQQPAPTILPEKNATSTVHDTADGLPAVNTNSNSKQPSVIPTPQYSGARLAGNVSPLLDFHKTDYDAAIASGKVVFLYFYANWCPICRAEFPKMQQAFDGLQTDTIIGFRVNFRDDQTDGDEVALARTFGVAYQHTKVVVQNGKSVLKAPDGWDFARYQSELKNYSK